MAGVMRSSITALLETIRSSLRTRAELEALLRGADRVLGRGQPLASRYGLAETSVEFLDIFMKRLVKSPYCS